MPGAELFTREEVLGGMPAQRARTLLFLIESRTAHLVAQSRRAMQWDLSTSAAQQQDFAFLEAFNAGKDPPLHPTIQDLERFAPQWAPLIPENPALRAALAKLLGEKYLLTSREIPGIRQALALDDPEIQRAFRRQQGTSLDTIFTARSSLVDRLRWRQAGIARRVESLPPFWTAFSLTLTETVGVGILALPIALAGIGPLPGVLLILLLGVVNLLTIAFLSEAVARSGEIRYGNAYFGRLVTDLLGRDGSVILRACLVLIYALALLAFFIGLSTTLADSLGLPAIAWASLIFLANIYFLRKESLNMTVSAALLVGFVNIGLILAICLIALPAINMDYLTSVNLPYLQGEPFDPAILALVFGTILLAYFGHTSMGNCARVVLQRDPSARSLIWGSLAAQIAAILLYSVWVLAVNGVVSPDILAAQTGTSLVPLADSLGPGIEILGSIFVILAMGMGSIQYSLGFYNLMRESIYTHQRQEASLLRRKGRLVLKDHGAEPGMSLGLTYQGLESGQAHFHLDVHNRGRIDGFSLRFSGRVDCWQLLKSIPDWRAQGHRLVLDLLEADGLSARLRLDSDLALSLENEWQAPAQKLGSLLDLPDDWRRLVKMILRLGQATPEELCAQTGLSAGAVRRNLDSLADQDYLRAEHTSNGTVYTANLARKHGAQLPEQVWLALEVAQPAENPPKLPWYVRLTGGILEALQSRPARFILATSPIAAIFLFTVWLLATGQESFTRPISFLGLVVASLLGVVFPVLLLVASRRKGEYLPQVVYRFMGNPFLLGCVYSIGVGGLFLHGLVIWQNPVERLVALSAGVLMLGMTIAMLKRGVFQPRAVVELCAREDRANAALLTVTANGEHLPINGVLRYTEEGKDPIPISGLIGNLSGIDLIEIQLPPAGYKDLKIWAHQITSAGNSNSLPVRVEIDQDEGTRCYDLRISEGQLLLPGKTDQDHSARRVRLISESDSPST